MLCTFIFSPHTHHELRKELLVLAMNTEIVIFPPGRLTYFASQTCLACNSFLALQNFAFSFPSPGNYAPYSSSFHHSTRIIYVRVVPAFLNQPGFEAVTS